MRFKVNKEDYNKIRKSIEDTWPDWKKELCNNTLLVSKNSKKLRIGKKENSYE